MNNPSNILPIFLYVIVNMKPVDMINMFRGMFVYWVTTKNRNVERWDTGWTPERRNGMLQNLNSRLYVEIYSKITNCNFRGKCIP